MFDRRQAAAGHPSRPQGPAVGAQSAGGELAGLAERVRQGDTSAEEEIARQFGERIRVMALARTRDREAARDLAQETMIGVLSALRRGQLREPDRLAAFVHGTARNLVNNYLRSRHQRPAEEPLPADLSGPDLAEEVELSYRLDLVRRALARLAASDRRILLMTLVDGLKPAEIAFQLGLTAEAARARKSRALKKVIEQVEKLSRTPP